MDTQGREVDQSLTVLLIAGNPGDARLVEEVGDDLGLAHHLHTVSNGPDALDFVKQRGEYTEASPTDLIILDWQLPGMGGEAVLTEVNGDPDVTHIPVIVATEAVSDREVRRIYRLNANACIPKPTSAEHLQSNIEAFGSFWLSTARLPVTDVSEP